MDKKKRNIIIIAVLAVFFVGAGIITGIMYTDDSDAGEGKDLKANEVEIVDESGDVKVVEKDSKEAEEYDKAVASGEREEVSEVKKTSSSAKNSTSTKKSSTSDKKNTGSSNTGTSNKKDTGTSNTGSSNKKDNGSSGSSGHTHNWVAVYKEVDNGYYKTVTSREAYVCCNACGADITSNVGPHMKEHALAGEKYASYRTEYRNVNTQEWVSNVEKVVDYYKCSCGATK